MNKELFLNEIDKELKTLSILERMKIIQYFNEIIDDHVEDGLTEEQAIFSLGDINDIVYSILETQELKKNNVDNKNKAKSKEQSEELKERTINTNFILVDNDTKNNNIDNKTNTNSTKTNNTNSTKTNNDENANDTHQYYNNKEKKSNKSKNYFNSDDLNFNIDKILKKTERMVEKGMEMAKKAINESKFNVDFDLSNKNENLISKTYDSGNNIINLHVEDINTGISITKSFDKKIHVIYYENENSKYNIDEQNGTLKIIKLNKDDRTFKWINYRSRNKLELQLPKDFYGNTMISTSNSSITIQDTKFNNIHLKTSNGKITIENLIIKGTLDCLSSNGSINVNKLICDKTMILKTSNGKIYLDNAYGSSIDCNTINSSINMYNSNFNDITLTTKNGKINFENLKVGNNLYCKTCNSTINGTILDNESNFSIYSNTSNGKNTLQNNSNGNKTINCYTSNGSILVYFTDNQNDEENNIKM